MADYQLDFSSSAYLATRRTRLVAAAHSLLYAAGITVAKYVRVGPILTLEGCSADPAAPVTVATVEAWVQAQEAAAAAAEAARLAEVAEIETFVTGDGFSGAKVAAVKAALAGVLADIAAAKADIQAAGTLAQLRAACVKLADVEEKLARHTASVVKQLYRRKVFGAEVQAE